MENKKFNEHIDKQLVNLKTRKKNLEKEIYQLNYVLKSVEAKIKQYERQ